MKGDENLNMLYTAGLAAGFIVGIVIGTLITLLESEKNDRLHRKE